MRTNGTIVFKIKTAGGIDPDTGYPVPPSVENSDPVPCLWQANKRDNYGVSSGASFTIANYSIIIEQRPLDSEVIDLYDRHGRHMGEFAVVSVSDADTKGRTVITV